jgi:hypothetical protein
MEHDRKKSVQWDETTQSEGHVCIFPKQYSMKYSSSHKNSNYVWARHQVVICGITMTMITIDEIKTILAAYTPETLLLHKCPILLMYSRNINMGGGGNPLGINVNLQVLCKLPTNNNFNLYKMDIQFSFVLNVWIYHIRPKSHLAQHCNTFNSWPHYYQN